jgi:hypothetical protein
MYTFFLFVAFAAGYGFHNWLNKKITTIVSAAVANVKADVTRLEAKVTAIKL